MRDRALELLELIVEALNRHEARAAVECLSEDVQFWEPTYPEPRRGREAVRRELEGFFAMLPDVRYTTEAVLVDGERVLHEWTYCATYEGRPVQVRECALGRLDSDGRLAEVRVYFDRLGLLRQLGLAPEL